MDGGWRRKVENSVRKSKMDGWMEEENGGGESRARRDITRVLLLLGSTKTKTKGYLEGKL